LKKKLNPLLKRLKTEPEPTGGDEEEPKPPATDQEA
jgi:hypothetical protein